MTKKHRVFLYARQSQEESHLTCTNKACRHEFVHRAAGNATCPKCGRVVPFELPLSIGAQRERMKAYCAYAFPEGAVEVIFVQEISSRITPFQERPQGKMVIETMEEGDHLVVTKMDRAWGNVLSFLECHKMLSDKKCHLHLVHEKIDTTSATGKMFATLLVMLAEFEWHQHSERRKSIAKHLKNTGRPYGPAPIGYRTVVCPVTGVKKLDRDETAMQLLEWVYILHKRRHLPFATIKLLADSHGFTGSTGNRLSEALLRKYYRVSKRYVADGILKPTAKHSDPPKRDPLPAGDGQIVVSGLDVHQDAAELPAEPDGGGIGDADGIDARNETDAAVAG